MMKNNLIIIFSIIFVIISSVGYGTAYSQGEEIPKWVKSTALLWGQGEIEDKEFFSLIKFLLEKEIVTVSNNQNITTEQESFTSSDYAVVTNALFQNYYITPEQESRLDLLHKQHDAILFQFELIDIGLEERRILLDSEWDRNFDERMDLYEEAGKLEFDNNGETVDLSEKQRDLLHTLEESISHKESEDMDISKKSSELRQEYETNFYDLTEAQRGKLAQKLAPIYVQYDKIHGEDFYDPLHCHLIINSCYYSPFPRGLMPELDYKELIIGHALYP